MKRAQALLFSSIVTCAATMAHAADITHMSLEELLEVEIVSSASKMSQKVSETPTAIRVITAQDIRRYGWRTLGEALSFLPGISVITNRYYDFIGARGAVLPDDYNTRYLMVIDGTPMNDALLESAFIGDAFPLDMALIQRIEYVPGAGSVAYGANAMLGTINITTQSAKGRHATEAEAFVDSIGRKSLRATTTQSFDNGAALTLSATGMRQEGRDQSYPDAIGNKTGSNGLPTTTGITHHLDSSRNNQLYAKLEQGGAKISLMLSDRINHPSTAPHGANFDDPAMKIQDRSFDLTANYTGEIARELTLYTNLTYMGYRNTTTTPRFKFTFPQQRYIAEQDSDAQRWFAEARLTTTRWSGHQTAVGLDLSKETKNDLLSHNSLGITDYHNDAPDSRLGLYFQDQWQFAENWQLHPGLRFDRSVMWGNHVSPRLGLTWQASPTLSLKAVAARAFRNPNPLESRAGKTPTPAPFETLSNMRLQAEAVDTHELVAEWRPSSALELSSSLYHHKLRQLIGIATTTGNDFQYQNLYGIDVTGLETVMHYHFASQWKLNTSLTLQDAQQQNGQPAPNAADWIAKLSANGPLWRSGIIAAGELYATGASSQSWNGKTVHNSTTIVSNLIFTASQWLPGAELQLRINNLFDRNDTIPGSDDTPVAHMPLYGRNASLSVRYAF